MSAYSLQRSGRAGGFRVLYFYKSFTELPNECTESLTKPVMSAYLRTMSLPTIGGGRGPSRAPTHKPLDHQTMMKLGLEVDEAADGQPITCDAMDELALEAGVDASALYAAAAVTTDVEFAREHDVVFIACGGRCQNWGALDAIEHLCTVRQKRRDEGQPTFDIQAKSCLDKCEQAPVVMVHTPDGSAVIPGANKKALDQAISQALES